MYGALLKCASSVYTSMSFGKLFHSCSSYPPTYRLFDLPRKSSSYSFLTALSHWEEATFILTSINLDKLFLFPDFTEWSCIICSLTFLTSFAQNIFELIIHVMHIISFFFLFLCNSFFVWIYFNFFIHSPADGHSLFSVFG